MQTSTSNQTHPPSLDAEEKSNYSNWPWNNVSHVVHIRQLSVFDGFASETQKPQVQLLGEVLTNESDQRFLPSSQVTSLESDLELRLGLGPDSHQDSSPTMSTIKFF